MDSDISFGRRNILIAGALSATTTAVPLTAGAAEALAPAQAGPPPSVVKFSFQVNGKQHALEVDTRT